MTSRSSCLGCKAVSLRITGSRPISLEAQQKTVQDYLNAGDWSLVGELTEIETGEAQRPAGVGEGPDQCLLIVIIVSPRPIRLEDNQIASHCQFSPICNITRRWTFQYCRAPKGQLLPRASGSHAAGGHMAAQPELQK